MSAISTAFVAFACLVTASLLAMASWPKLPARHRDDATNDVVRLVANIFVVVASLVFGLMVNSSKNTFENINQNVHAYATDLILLDQMLRSFGPSADSARGQLKEYVQEAIVRPERIDDVLKQRRSEAEHKLQAFARELAAISPADRFHEALLLDIRQQYREIFSERWQIVEQSEGAIPMPLIAMMIAWFSLIFASFGYRSPCNVSVVSMFVVSSLLLAGSIYLILDMDVPFAGPIQISDAPLRRVLAEIDL